MLYGLFACLVFGFGYLSSQNSPQRENTVKRDRWIVPLKRCSRESQTFYSNFGSERVSVVGRDKQNCRLNIRREKEGAYVIRECRIPVKLKQLEIREQTVKSDYGDVHQLKYSADVAKYCRATKSGNLLTDGPTIK
jgi:hypothetical protein